MIALNLSPVPAPLAGTHLAAAVAPQNATAAVLSTPGFSSMLAERLRQIEDFGHTPEADAALPLIQFQLVVQRIAHGITRPGGLDDKARLRRKLVQLAAFSLAFIDRLDREQLP